MQELATKPISTQLGRGVVRQTWGKKGKKQERKPREEGKDALCWTQDPPKPPTLFQFFRLYQNSVCFTEFPQNITIYSIYLYSKVFAGRVFIPPWIKIDDRIGCRRWRYPVLYSYSSFRIPY
jgi:hypothetical protein